MNLPVWPAVESMCAVGACVKAAVSACVARIKFYVYAHLNVLLKFECIMQASASCPYLEHTSESSGLLAS